MLSTIRKNHQIFKWILLISIVSSGTILRFHFALTSPFRVDEAESSINALSILKNGVPTSSYLGLPIYENTLSEPWPNHKEYEFRDSSYSDRGLATYHGWLPLYSIAGAFAMAGIEVDEVTTPLRGQHGADEHLFRKVVPRLPALGFSICFMLLAFATGRILGGKSVGWMALVIVAFAQKSVAMGSIARYYSASAMFSICCGLLLWRIIHAGRWRDFMAFAATSICLFHTHSLTCVVLCCVFGLMAPLMLKYRHALFKIFSTGVIVIAGVIPWVIFTGFLDRAVVVPKAISLMDFPVDLFQYPKDNLHISLPFLSSVVLLFVAVVWGRRLPKKIVQPILNRKLAIIFLAIWGCAGYFIFIGAIPAASYFFPRLSLTIAAPSALMLAILASVLSEAFVPRNFKLPLYFILVVALNITGHFCLPGSNVSNTTPQSNNLAKLIDYLEQQEFTPGTRLYAFPNYHLVYTYFTGLPIQSIAPIRKSFLDDYGNDIIIILPDAVPNVATEEIRKAAEAAEQTLSADEVRRHARNLTAHLFGDVAPNRAGLVEPSLFPVPNYLELVLARYRREREVSWRAHAEEWGEHILMRGFKVRNYSDWWQVFCYRFSNPEQRSGPKVNYAERIRNARAVMIQEAGVVVYDANHKFLSSPNVLTYPNKNTKKSEYSLPGSNIRSGSPSTKRDGA